MDPLLKDAAERASRYLEGLPTRSVAPSREGLQGLDRLDTPLPEAGEDPGAVLSLLDEYGSPGTVATAGGRYFGFVIGSALPAALAANWLAGAWNQNVALEVMSPAAARLERVALRWMRDLLGLPPTAEGAFVTGDTMANFAGLAAARHALLKARGWDVATKGLFGAPPFPVVVSEEVHVSVLKALSMVGLGRERVLRVPVDDQGRMRPEELPRLDGPALVCVQAGNVNTGAVDPVGEICEKVRPTGSWVHVDGAFGLWAGACPSRAHLTEGVSSADSWAVDGHKWLNVPYDSGTVFVRDGGHLRSAMTGGSVAYLPTDAKPEGMEYAPEMSRRARGVDAWAALRSLGRAGVADLVDRSCRHARRLADRMREGGHRILNDVVLNQVLVDFGSAERTRRVIDAVQQDGTCWCGGTEWRGVHAMRISVSSWATRAEDVERCADAILRVASD